MSYTIQRMPYQGCYRIWTFVWTGEKRSITPSGLVFFKYLNREKISVFKNIRIRVHGRGFGKNKILLVWGNIPYPLTSCSRRALSSLLSLPVSSLAKEEVFTIARATATAETSVSIMTVILNTYFFAYIEIERSNMRCILRPLQLAYSQNANIYLIS